jgi:hypothetical protein
MDPLASKPALPVAPVLNFVNKRTFCSLNRRIVHLLLILFMYRLTVRPNLELNRRLR